jgi:hypothetical protein
LALVDGERYQEFDLEEYAYSKITEIRSQRKITVININKSSAG